MQNELKNPERCRHIYTCFHTRRGGAFVSCNEFTDVHFKAGEIFLLPINSSCTWHTLSDTNCLILNGSNDQSPCDKIALSELADSTSGQTGPIRKRESDGKCLE